LKLFLKVLWDGQGNLGNVFFGRPEGANWEFAICGIDQVRTILSTSAFPLTNLISQCITSITTHDRNLQRYLGKVDAFLDDLEAFEKSGASPLIGVRFSEVFLQSYRDAN